MNQDAFARSSDPVTSHEAIPQKKRTNELEGIVFEHLPGTTEQVADATGLSLVTVSPRIKPMVRKGLVRDSGRKATNRSGKRAIVWEPIPGAAI